MASNYLSMRSRMELARAELCQASWYLYLKRTPILESPIAGYHFLAHPRLGLAWDRCKALAEDGQTWELYEVFGQAENAAEYQKVTDNTDWGMPVANERMMLQCFEAHELIKRLRRSTTRFQDNEISVEDWLVEMKEGTRKIETHEPDTGLLGAQAASRGLDLCRGAGNHTSVPFSFLPEPWRDIPTKHVHVVGAETSGHKTTWAINAALSVARAHNPETGEDMPVAYYTAEDSNDLIIARMLTHISDENLRVRDIMRGQLKDRMGAAFRANKVLGELPIKFFDGARPIEEVLAMLYRDWAKRKTVLDVIDYIGDIELNEGRGAPLEIPQLTSMVKRFDRMAKRCNKAVVIVVQFKHEYSNTLDADGNTRPPVIGNIYGGSRICQKAHSVFLNHTVQRGVEGSEDERIKTYVRKFKTEGKGVVKLRVDPVHNRIWSESFFDIVGPKVLKMPTRHARNSGFTRQPKD